MAITPTDAHGVGLHGPADQHAVRDHNLSLVARHVAHTGETSRAQLATATGLNKSTISNLVGELLERRLVIELGVRAEGQVGRPPVRVRMTDETWAAIGLEVNVHYLAMNIITLDGQVIDRSFELHDNRAGDQGSALELAARLGQRAAEAARERGFRIIGIGLGVPGLVDPVAGKLLTAPNVDWLDVAVGDLIDRALPHGAPIRVVENEANLAALAERWRGVGRDLDNFLLVSGEIGVGAGVIVDSTLARGGSGLGGEFGHMTLIPDGPHCGCGSRGCVEALVGFEAMLDRVGMDPVSALESGQTGEFGPITELVDAARRGQPEVLAGLADIGNLLGVALSSAMNLLGPQPIVLGGYYGPLIDWLHAPITAALKAGVLGAPHGSMPVIASTLGREAATRGAAEVVVRQVIADPAAIAVPA